MNPADKRLSELLDKWLASLQLHLKYSALDDDTYRQAQPWPVHDRPSRWIVEMALQKVKLLQEQLNTRVSMGDAKFSDALELMGFLTNLVGSQHIRRFIPLAEPQSENPVTPTPPAQSQEGHTTVVTPALIMLAPVDLTSTTAERSGVTTRSGKALRSDSSPTGTREMPRPKIAGTKPAGRRDSKESKEPAKESKSSATQRAKALSKAVVDRDRQVLDDAKRLLKWGRKWHELPELISRMADRPSMTEVRRLLRENKATLDPG